MPYAVGAPHSLSDEVTVVQFNDVEGAREAIKKMGSQLAAVLLDPMPSRVGMPVLSADFKKAIREGEEPFKKNYFMEQ